METLRGKRYRAQKQNPHRKRAMYRPPQTPRDTALQTAETGRKIAACIWDAITAEKPEDADILGVYATRLAQCNSNGNLWTAQDMHNEHGEAFDGNGRFWLCGSKLCSYCLKKQSQRSRKLVRQAIASQRVIPYDETTPLGLPVGQHYHFLTLTMPKAGLTILDARDVLNDGWSLLRKRKWWRATILGGARSEEFTQSKKGTHYHMHLIVRSRFINYSSFRHTWTECLDSAFRKNGLILSCATTDSLAIANVKRIGCIEDAIKEVAKYLTKCTSWRQVDTSQLLDLCRVERWPRMFELFGSFKPLQSSAVLEEDKENLTNRVSLDTKEISDGDPDLGWRETVRRVGVAEYLDQLDEEQNQQYQIRKQQLQMHYGAARFRRIQPTSPINKDQILKRLFSIYWQSNRPPPPTMRVGLDLQSRLNLNAKFGLSIEPVNLHR